MLLGHGDGGAAFVGLLTSLAVLNLIVTRDIATRAGCAGSPRDYADVVMKGGTAASKSIVADRAYSD